MNLNNLTHAVLPRPGCDNGGLDWEMVKSKINHILDERVIVVNKER